MVGRIRNKTVNTNRHKPTNRSPLRELNLQTNQTKSQISIASNIETCSNQLSPKKPGRKKAPSLSVLKDIISSKVLGLFYTNLPNLFLEKFGPTEN
ncbi:hypothetical protein BpHYR1_053778 [Brachionus plicatilis]|uniref:Uncharacterized protein n=1 Tax=Brachionus plicatilis TaxID=10195 RepID=A0A3M7RB04_BRAPC|nr:hypothetical protein BpHYR1_053778 [Brachionus plicatilis]